MKAICDICLSTVARPFHALAHKSDRKENNVIGPLILRIVIAISKMMRLQSSIKTIIVL